MNGITHKQAQKYVRLDLDGLLTDDQRRDLETHLSGCEACRADAQAFSQLTSRLQSGFHARWDAQDGPSKNVMANVRSQTRRIIMSNRINVGLKALGGVAAVLVFGLLINLVVSQMRDRSVAANVTVTPDSLMPVSAQAADRLLAFTMEKDGNLDIYTVRADGTGLTNLTNLPEREDNPYWSSDGKRIAFNRIINDQQQIFVMNADGSNIIQLTEDGAFNKLVSFEEGREFGFDAWSPDGKKLVFVKEDTSRANTGKWMKLYVLDVETKTQTPLTGEWGSYQSPAWSPDGEHVAFTSLTVNEQGEPDQRSVQVVDVNGNNLVDLTESLPGYLSPVFRYWSRDGQSIFFSAHGDGAKVYEARLDGSLIEHVSGHGGKLLDWWNGITLLQESSEKTALTWLHDGTVSSLEICPNNDLTVENISYTRSNVEHLFFGVQCSPGEWSLYLSNKDGSTVQTLLDSPLYAGDGVMVDQAWSPDDNYVAFNISSQSGPVEMFILNVANALADPSTQPVKTNVGDVFSFADSLSWQPVINNDIAKEEPTPEPTQISYRGLIAFASEQDGNYDIYTMHPDGSGLTNLTNDPAHDTNPIWSPDGKRIAFESERDGFIQIYLIDADGSNLIQFTNDKADHGLYLNIDSKYSPWSPDSSKLLFLQSSKGGELAELYVQDITGENKILLARRGAQRISWSPDGKYIGYVLNDSPNLSETIVPGIYVVDADGSNPRELKKLIPQDEYLKILYYWSSDGQSIIFITDKNDPARQVIYSLPQTVYEFNLETNTLLHKGTLKPTVIDWGEEVSLSLYTEKGGSSFVWQRSDGTSNTLAWDDSNCLRDITRSLHGNFAIGAYCLDSKKFKLYWANADGSTIKQLLDWPISIGSFADITWSPDDQYVAFTLDSSLYILNVEDALKDSSIQPGQVVIAPYTIPSWQPVIPEEIVEQKPTPEPTQTSSNAGLIAFPSAVENGNLDIYTMRMDGSNVKNITNNPADDSAPVWSPDGTRIAFLSERTGNSDIFAMNPDGSDVTQLTDNPGYDGFVSWSPDGQKIVYLSSPGSDPNENSELVVMNGDGSDKVALMPEVGSYISHAWSPDSQKVIFTKQEPNPELKVEDAGIYIVNVDGSNLLKLPIDYLQQVEWEDDNHFYGVVLDNSSFDHTLWSIYRFNINGGDPERIASHSAPGADILGIFENVYVVQSNNELRWYPLNGSRTALTTWKYDMKCDQANHGPYANPVDSPDHNFVFVNVYCIDETVSFYLMNTDGSMIKQLTAVPVDNINQIMGINWSTDAKYLLLTVSSRDDGYMELFLLNIEKLLKDPSSKPLNLTQDSAWRHGYQAEIQPMP